MGLHTNDQLQPNHISSEPYLARSHSICGKWFFPPGHCVALCQPSDTLIISEAYICRGRPCIGLPLSPMHLPGGVTHPHASQSPLLRKLSR
uniref:Uncharacterized protein n=1 Tax=Myripristis murdjan TaxID=586833 RepID=A0A667XC76_9TELE